MKRKSVCLAFMAGAWLLLGAPAQAAPETRRLMVEPVAASIPLGKVDLTLGALTRQQGVYRGSYRVKVSPLNLGGEAGTIAVPLTDESLRKLAAGATVSFHGQAINDKGKPRRVEGRAMPSSDGGGGGTIKVKVWTGKRKMVFDTRYQFAR
jgi:hypothetical protein